MSDDRDDILDSDVPNDVVIQEALAPFLGGFEQAEKASKAAYEALCVTYKRAVVEAEDLDIVLNRGDKAVGWQRYSEACNRLRAALPKQANP